jgi:hypothetical protein
VFDDTDCPEAYSPICYDPGDDDEENDHEEEEDNDDGNDDDEACILSRVPSEDKNSEHVSILIFLTFSNLSGIF